MSGVACYGYFNLPHIELVGEKTMTLPYNESFKDPDVKVMRGTKELKNPSIKLTYTLDNQKLGSYDITYRYSFFGLAKQLTRTVKVVDNEKPSLTLVGSDHLQLAVGTPYNELGVNLADNYDSVLEKQVQIEQTVDNQTPGTYDVTYSLSDHSGNKTKIQRKVTVFQPEGDIFLTFDDGPAEETTPAVLDILKTKQIKATFFETGRGPDDLIKRTYDEGHTIALHTFSHDYANVYQSTASYFNDLTLVRERVKKLTGIDSTLIRFPGGSSNTISDTYSPGIMSRIIQDVNAKGYRYFDWNVSSGDGGTQPSSEAIYTNVVTNLKKGQEHVVLMHDTNKLTVGALQQIIQYGKDNHFAFKMIDDTTTPVHHR